MRQPIPFARTLFFVLLSACLLTGLAGTVRTPVSAAPQMQAVVHVVISQVYGGGGNTGATYINDYVELFNPSDGPLSVDGWSIQYTSPTGTGLFSANVVNLAGSLSAGQYYLVQLASGGANGAALPTPEAIGSIDMGATNGKVVLVSTTTGLPCNGGSTPCTPSDLANIVDLVGYGSANFFEGSGAAPAVSNTMSALRNGNGCTDTDNNIADFVAGVPTPRNTGYGPIISCSNRATSTAAANQTGTAGADLTNTAIASNLTASADVNNTGTAAANATGTAVANNTGTALALTSAASMGVVISEFRTRGPGGGNDEFIELYNRTGSPIPIGGWTINKSSGCGSTITAGIATINAGMILAPGQHYLIAGTSYVGSQDQTNDLSIANDGGIALLSGTTIIDQVGLCASTFYREGTALSQLTSDTDRSYDRNSSGGICVDTNNNAADFFLRSPSDPQNSFSPLTICGNPTLTPTVTRTPTRTRTPTPVRTATPTRTATRLPPPPPLLAINEFVPRPGHDWNNDGLVNTSDEYIELLNYGVISVNLSGYRLDDEANIGSAPFTLPSVTLQPGERIVFYGSQTKLLLSDGGDGVRLLKPNGQLMDAYNYFVVQFPDQSFCRLPDDGGADTWNENCYPTPGLKNSLSGSILRPPTQEDEDQPLCPIADTLPEAFVIAECSPFGNNIWNRSYWDKFGWYGEMSLPNAIGKWEVFAD